MGCRIPLNHIPFSRYGAYLAISEGKRSGHLILHDVRRSFGDDQIYKICFWEEGREADCEVWAEPECVTVRSGERTAKLYIRDDEVLVVDSVGLDMTMRQTNEYGYGIENPPCYHIINIHHHLYTSVYVQQGEGKLKGPVRKGNGPETADVRQNLTLRCTDGRMTAMIHIGEQERKFSDKICADEEIKCVREEWESFLSQLPKRAYRRMDYAVITWYNLWSSFVRKGGHYHDDTMIMSKKGMCAVWSWDHCFNALSMAAAGKEEEAWNQFAAPFYLQSANGCLPDMWRPNSEITWTITKPPVHGWCLKTMMEWMTLTDEQLRAAYTGLERWTEWWMEYRDYDGDGIPAYPMGCDSGWDNTTVFDEGYFVETPDLSAYLILQMDVLRELAEKIKNRTVRDAEKKIWEKQGQKWEKRKQELKETFYAHSWKDGRFVSKKSGTHERVKSNSLIEIMPLVLGEELDQEKRRLLIERLKREFLTEYGPATENPLGGKYESDGYWRGPIWAPVTFLLVDGLYRGGEKKLAAEIADRFCRMLEDRAGGNYENFDALTGEGLRAPGYTWTASVYLLLCWQYRADESA